MTLLLKCAIAVCFAGLISSSVVHDAANLSSSINSKGRMVDEEDLICPASNSKYPVLLPHPEDCGKFYICDSGVPHLKVCQSGLHFNPKIKACDYPQNSQCDTAMEKPEGRVIEDDLDSCPTVNPRYPVYLPHPEDCNKFYICDGGSRHLKICQSGLHFNPRINACDYPEKAGCDIGSSIKPKERIIDDDMSPCPATNSKYPVLLPHPEDCGKFYICDTGVPHMKVCQSGLHFNPKIKACDYPRNAQCDSGSSIKPRERIIDNLNPCPATNSKYPVLLPHPEDCGKFYICDTGVPHLKVCQSGLHFNPKIKACDYPRNAQCDTEKPEGRLNEDDLDSECPSVNSRFPVYIPHPEDCNKFYICDSGSRHLKVCQSGLHFNPKINACDYPEKAGCDSEGSRKSEVRKIDGEFRSCPDDNSATVFHHEEDCRLFYACDNGTATVRICPEGLHFNPNIYACDYPEEAGCVSESSRKFEVRKIESDFRSCPNDDSLKVFHHEEDCRLFYMCDNGIARLRMCPEGLHFNPRLLACDNPKNAGCLTETADKLLAADPSPYCPPKNGKHPIFYRHPTNCSIYYMCNHGLAHEFVCPARLHFNVRKKVCDYEKDAGCRNS